MLWSYHLTMTHIYAMNCDPPNSSAPVPPSHFHIFLITHWVQLVPHVCARVWAIHSTGACFTDQGPHPWKMALPPPAARSRFSWSLPPPMLECWLAWSSAGLGQAATVAVRSQVQQPCFIQKMLFHSSLSWTLLESFYPLLLWCV